MPMTSGGWERAFQGAEQRYTDRMTPARALALKGDRGAAGAQDTLDKILSSNASPATKAWAKRKFEEGGNELPDDAPIWKKGLDLLGRGGELSLMAIDKLKRASVATVNEVAELGPLAEEDDSSWADNVFRKAEYGYGDLHQQILEDQGAEDTWLGNKWVKRGVGITGDVLLDPLTYVGVGVVDDLGRGGKAAAKALEGADEVAEGAGKVGAGRRFLDAATRGGKSPAKLDLAELQRRAIDLGDEGTDILGKLAGKNRGAGRLSTDELAQLGARGGWRAPEFLGGKTLVGAGVTGKIGAPLRALRQVEHLPGVRQALDNLGGENLREFRQVLRGSKSAPADAVGDYKTARTGIDAVRRKAGAEADARKRFGAAMDALLKGPIDEGVDGKLVRRAFAGDAEAAAQLDAIIPGATDNYKTAIEAIRVEVNERAGSEVIAKVDDYFPRVLTDEAMDLVSKRTDEIGKAGWGESGHASRRFKEGDKVGKYVIGSDEAKALANGSDLEEDQVEAIIREMGGPANIYEEDAYAVLPVYAERMAKMYGSETGKAHLRAKGVISESVEKLEQRISKLEAKLQKTRKGIDRGKIQARIQMLQDEIERTQAVNVDPLVNRRERLAGELGDVADFEQRFGDTGDIPALEELRRILSEQTGTTRGVDPRIISRRLNQYGKARMARDAEIPLLDDLSGDVDDALANVVRQSDEAVASGAYERAAVPEGQIDPNAPPGAIGGVPTVTRSSAWVDEAAPAPAAAATPVEGTVNGNPMFKDVTTEELVRRRQVLKQEMRGMAPSEGADGRYGDDVADFVDSRPTDEVGRRAPQRDEGLVRDIEAAIEGRQEELAALRASGTMDMDAEGALMEELEVLDTQLREAGGAVEDDIAPNALEADQIEVARKYAKELDDEIALRGKAVKATSTPPSVKTRLPKMTKRDLLDYARTMGIEDVNVRMTRAELRKKILAQEELLGGATRDAAAPKVFAEPTLAPERPIDARTGKPVDVSDRRTIPKPTGQNLSKDITKWDLDYLEARAQEIRDQIDDGLPTSRAKRQQLEKWDNEIANRHAKLGTAFKTLSDEELEAHIARLDEMQRVPGSMTGEDERIRDAFLEELNRRGTGTDPIPERLQNIADDIPLKGQDERIAELEASAQTLRQKLKDATNDMLDAEDAARTGARMPGSVERIVARKTKYAEDLQRQLSETRDEIQALRALPEEAQKVRKLGSPQAEARGSLAGPIVDEPIQLPNVGEAPNVQRAVVGAAEAVGAEAEQRKVIQSAQAVMDQANEAGRLAMADRGELFRRTKAALDEVEAALDTVSPRNPNRKAALESAQAHRKKIMEMIDVLDGDIEAEAQYVVGLQMAAEESAAQLDEKLAKAMTLEDSVTALQNRKAQAIFQKNGRDGMVAFGRDLEEAPGWMVDAFLRSSQAFDDPQKLAKFIDAANRGFKTYAVLTPGFHARNSMGAFFNNFAAGVDVGSYVLWGKLSKQYRKGGIEAVDAEWRPIVQQMQDSGRFAEGNRFTSEAAEFAGKEGDAYTLKHIATDNPLTRLSRGGGNRVEDYHRGALMFDTLRKGGGIDLARDKVFQFHFDYSDLSQFEKKYVKRIIPFWTWTSRNMPLQFESMMRNPKTYSRFNIFRDNMDIDRDPLAPEYVRRSPVAIRMDQKLGTLPDFLPFGLGGSEANVDYLMPDLPFAQVDETTKRMGEDPVAGLLQDAAPIFKTPLEMIQDKQFFGDIPLNQDYNDPEKGENLPAWTKMPGLLPALSAFNYAKKDSKGRWRMRGEHVYAIEQALPTLGKIKRQAPSEDKYQERVFTAWLSFLGLGSRNVGPTERTNEMYRRDQQLKERAQQEKQLGTDIESVYIR
jgi:hypothetical protein